MKGSVKMVEWALALAMGLVGLAQASGSRPAAAAPALAQASDPISVVTTYVREYPGDAALDLLSDDAVVTIVPPPPGTSGVWTGKEAIRTGLFPFARSQNSRPEIIGSPVVEGNKVTARVMVQTNDFRRLGVGPVEHTNEAVVEGGKIKSFTSTMIPSERERVAAAARAAQPPAGMPRTGGEQSWGLTALLLILAAVATTAGGILRRKQPGAP